MCRYHENLIYEAFQQSLDSEFFKLGYEFGGSGSCKGDSGGPLMRYTYDNGPSSARFVQQGIVQGGVGTCGSKDFPSIYVRVKDPEVFEFIQISLAGGFC